MNIYVIKNREPRKLLGLKLNSVNTCIALLGINDDVHRTLT